MKFQCVLYLTGILLLMPTLVKAQDVWLPDGVSKHLLAPVKQVTPCSDLITTMDIAPFVQARAGDMAGMRVSVAADRDDVAQVRMLLPDYLFRSDGESGETWVVMRDDGAGGDSIPEDGVFSIGNLFVKPAEFREDELYNRFGFDPQFELTFDSGAVETAQFGCRRIVFSYDPALVVPVDIVQRNDSTQETPHVVNMTTSHPGQIRQQEASLLIRNVSNAFYKTYPDDRDFLIFSMLHPVENAPPANYWSIKQSIAGLGYEAIDMAGEFGSGGQLKGIIGQYNGGLAPRVVVHEFLHRWAAFLPEALELTSPVFPSHWEFLDRPNSGFGPINYSAEITLLTDSTFSVPFEENPVWRYSDLELYLMGLIPPEEVASPIRVFIGSENIDFVDDGAGGFIEVYKFESIRDVTMDEILAAAGARTPDHASSQKAFKTGFIIVYDRPLLPKELAFFDLFASVYGEPTMPEGWLPAFDATFEEATFGMAQMDTRLAAPLPIAVDPVSRAKESVFTIFPNPANAYAVVDFTLQRESTVSIEAVDMLGRMHTLSAAQHLVAGTHAVRVSTATLPAGTYVIRLRGGHDRMYSMFTIFR